MSVLGFIVCVPRAGVEPARVAPLVFETSASTDSAIWAAFRSRLSGAVCDAKVSHFFLTSKKKRPKMDVFVSFCVLLATYTGKILYISLVISIKPMEVMRNRMDYCIILAGGVGRRLWPCSRKELPKQFIDFFGTGRTLLQQTYDRCLRFICPENILVSTFAGYEDLVRSQLPGLPAANILSEPVQLSTAPAVSWASRHIALHAPDANIVVVPSDQHIVDEDRFVEQIARGLRFVASHDNFLAIGVKPTTPNTAYGYIQTGAECDGDRLWRVKSFSEKPAAEFARTFVDSGEFLWNTGIFLWNARTMLRLLDSLTPQVAQLMAEQGNHLSPADELKMVNDYYPANLHRSIDLIILDVCDNAFVQECDFGWADIGSWPEMYKVTEKDADDNAVLGGARVLFSGCSGNMVALPEGMGAVLKGLDGYLVAQEGNMLVICPNEDPALVRRLANEARMELGEEYI